MAAQSPAAASALLSALVASRQMGLPSAQLCDLCTHTKLSNLSASWVIYWGVGCSSKQRSGMQKCLCSNQFPMWNPAAQGCFSASVQAPKSQSKAKAFLDVLLKVPAEWKELAEGPSCSAPFLLCIHLSPDSAPKGEWVLGMHKGAVISFRSLWESQCRVSAMQDAKGSVVVVHWFHNHKILVLHHSRIFLQPLFVWALGTNI